jgi:hypothetical protein
MVFGTATAIAYRSERISFSRVLRSFQIASFFWISPCLSIGPEANLKVESTIAKTEEKGFDAEVVVAGT